MSLMDVLSGVGTVLDTPGAFVRTSLAGQNPFPGIFDPEQRVSGRGLLEQLGVLDENQEGLDGGDVGGFLAELLTDPTMLIPGVGGYKLGKHLGKFGKSAGMADEAVQALPPPLPGAMDRLAAEDDQIMKWLEPDGFQMVGGPSGPSLPIVDAPQPLGLPAPQSPFYSRLERAVEGLPGNQIKTQSLLNQLRKSPEGFSMEEWQWRNMPEVLGKPTIAKSELMQHLQSNPLDVQKTVMGKQSVARDYAEQLTIEDVEDLAAKMHTSDSRSWMSEVAHKMRAGATAREAMQESPGAIQHIIQSHAKTLYGGDENLARWSEYKLPGADDSYRETLMRLPENIGSPEDLKRLSEIQSITDYSGLENREFLDVLKEQEEISKRIEAAKKSNYDSPHFEQPNILAHVRSTERKGPLGRTLHAEEIQSDWHQAGRERGYPSDVTIAEIKTASGEQSWRAMTPRGGAFGYIDKLPNGKFGVFYPGLQEHIADTLEEAKQHLSKIVVSDFNLVPDAPFKEDWPLLALKQLIDDAARGGYDAASWNTGSVIQDIVGGELGGQKKFYNEILPNTADKYFKNRGWDTQVTPTITEPDYNAFGFPITDQMRKDILTRGQPLLQLLLSLGAAGGVGAAMGGES
jgi:hypothetical protein